MGIEGLECLKDYRPCARVLTLTNAKGLSEIDAAGMREPKKEKWQRYEQYYLDNKKAAHDIIVDENGRIRDGYKEHGKKRYCWIYDIDEAVVPGDILLVQTSKGHAYMKVWRIGCVCGKEECGRYKKVKWNISAKSRQDVA